MRPILIYFAILLKVVTAASATLPIVPSAGCGAYLTSPTRLTESQILQMQVESPGYTNDRGLVDYLKVPFISAELVKIDRPNFHWLDVGGGLGLAGLESFFAPSLYVDELREFLMWESSNSPLSLQKLKLRRRDHHVTVVNAEDLVNKYYPKEKRPGTFGSRYERLEYLATKSMRDRFDSLISSGHFQYLVGRFEDLPASSIAQADLITDFYGAFSYSAHKFEVLAKMAQLLKVGGTAVLVAGSARLITPDHPEGMAFSDLLEQVPGIEVWGNYLTMRPTSQTIERLLKLASKVEFDHAVGPHFPPVFFYKLRDGEFLE